jgi:hypothetical protein
MPVLYRHSGREFPALQTLDPDPSTGSISALNVTVVTTVCFLYQRTPSLMPKMGPQKSRARTPVCRRQVHPTASSRYPPDPRVNRFQPLPSADSTVQQPFREILIRPKQPQPRFRPPGSPHSKQPIPSRPQSQPISTPPSADSTVHVPFRNKTSHLPCHSLIPLPRTAHGVHRSKTTQQHAPA